jgi:hypothetical protein
MTNSKRPMLRNFVIAGVCVLALMTHPVTGF